jgi:hypothetical protein
MSEAVNHIDMLLDELAAKQTDDDKTVYLKETVLPALVAYDPVTRALKLKRIAKILGIDLKSVKQLMDFYLDDAKLDTEEKPQNGEAKEIPTAIFPGLVDIVEHDGKPAFLLLQDGELVVTPAIPGGEGVLVPPEKKAMPWMLPRSDEVKHWYANDNDQALFDDLVGYHGELSSLPLASHYKMLAAYDMLTYMQEKILYLPEIVLEGLPERGKSRTGKGVVYVAYRGIHETSVRDTHLVRYCAEYQATLFLDCMDFWKKVEKQASEDIILGRFEKGQTVRRVLWPERGLYRDSQYYSIFGPTLIGSNRSLEAILETRCLSLTLPEAGKNFTQDVRPETSLPFRERLVAFRARHMTDELPDVAKPCAGRLGDITRCLVQVMRLVSPADVPELRLMIEDFRRQRMAAKMDSWPARVFQVFLRCEPEIVNGVVPVAAVVRAFNVGLTQDKQVTPQSIGKILAHIGLEPARLHESKKAYRWPNPEQIAKWSASLGLTPDTGSGQEKTESENDPGRAQQTSPSSPSSPSSPEPTNGDDQIGDLGDLGDHGDVSYESQAENSLPLSDIPAGWTFNESTGLWEGPADDEIPF